MILFFITTALSATYSCDACIPQLQMFRQALLNGLTSTYISNEIKKQCSYWPSEYKYICNGLVTQTNSLFNELKVSTDYTSICRKYNLCVMVSRNSIKRIHKIRPSLQ